MSIGGGIIGTDNLADALQIAADSGAIRVLIPAVDMVHYGTVPTDLISKLQPIIYTDPVDAAMKAMGVN